jgi:superfamily II helicase
VGILDNLEAYLEKAENRESCHFCQGMAKYDDIAETDINKYDMVSVCERHAFKGLSS